MPSASLALVSATPDGDGDPLGLGVGVLVGLCDGDGDTAGELVGVGAGVPVGELAVEDRAGVAEVDGEDAGLLGVGVPAATVGCDVNGVG